MRAEYSFWEGMFVLIFLDELYPQTLQPDNNLFDMELKNVETEILHKKLKQIQKTDLQKFINKQIAKHNIPFYLRPSLSKISHNNTVCSFITPQRRRTFG